MSVILLLECLLQPAHGGSPEYEIHWLLWASSGNTPRSGKPEVRMVMVSMRKNVGPGDILVQSLALFLLSRVTLGKLLNPSGPQFPHLLK